MSARGGKDRPVPPPPPEGEDLLTSEDLFGEFVDQPPDTPTTSARHSEPIRVKVREHLAPPPQQEVPKPLAPDVEALLDAFSGPGEAATREAPPTPVEEPKKEETPVRPAARIPVAAAPEEFDTLLQALEPQRPAEPRTETIAESSRRPTALDPTPAAPAQAPEIRFETIADSGPRLKARAPEPPLPEVPVLEVAPELPEAAPLDELEALAAAPEPMLKEPVLEVVPELPTEPPLHELEALAEVPEARPKEPLVKVIPEVPGEPPPLDELEALAEAPEPRP